ncbi:hypothetical protein [Evansella cellulosilytica]|uniref:Uncharacterized protein n=1 Tax=Evansella cellulosilytica (strain ATCC 21833 / DSM 2522 / FERM P-1141 / JCM 9156 / N-4) TaxID=649639 RepID=E6TVI6_EVAC2|nr:hypothetical protein [Evansella cellulosilytica]ADU31003.1 hypothetical protein Bcell_2748 [Evansella cellulosilytica DSM 2522]
MAEVLTREELQEVFNNESPKKIEQLIPIENITLIDLLNCNAFNALAQQAWKGNGPDRAFLAGNFVWFAKRFLGVQYKHYLAWESEVRKEQHSLDNIHSVKWVNEEKCFHVHYKKTKHFNKEWYHYDPADETWW